MEQSQRTAHRNASIGLSLTAGLLCLGIALAHVCAATLGPLPRVPAPVRWASEPLMPTLAAGWQAVEGEAIDGEADDDEPINAMSAPAPDAWDGLYVGSATTRDGSRVTYGVTVRGGVGSGTQNRLDCGTAPLALRISAVGGVSGMATVFGPTCLRSEVALRGRAIGGYLQLRLGTQYLELAKP